MWTSFINTLNGFVKLAPRHIKSWSPFVFQASIIFFIIGTIAGMLIIPVLPFLGSDYYDFNLTEIKGYWWNSSLQCGGNVMLIGCGMTAGAFSRNTTPPSSFNQFSRETPRTAWRQFIICTLLIATFSSVALYLDVLISSYPSRSGGNLTSYYTRLKWGQSVAILISSLLTGSFAGAVFIKAAGGPGIRLYLDNLKILIVLGIVLRFSINAVFSYIYTLAVSPLVGLTPVSPESENIILLAAMSIPALMIVATAFFLRNIWTWLICGAFYEEELDFDLEKEIQSPIQE